MRPSKPAKPTQISAEKISDLIGRICDCVLAPENWRLVLEAIDREFSFVAAALGVSPLRRGAQVFQVAAGVDPEWQKLLPDYQTEVAPLWGGAERMGQFALDEPVVATHAAVQAWKDNRYFRKVPPESAWCPRATLCSSL